MNTPAPTNQTGLAWLAFVAAVLGVLLAVWQVMNPRPELAGFNLNQAMEVAGAEVPKDLESFYFFVPEAGRSRRVEIIELSQLLTQAATEQDYIGLAGADAERNREALLAALKEITAGLNGATVVYLGPEEHRSDIQAAVEKSNGQVKFVPYPPLPDNAI